MGINDIQLIIKVDTRGMIKFLRKYTQSLEKNLKIGSKTIIRRYAEIYLKHIRASGIKPWTGQSEGVLQQQMIEPTRVGKGYAFYVPAYLIALNKFNKQPHWVELRPGRSITKWYKQKIGGLSGKLADQSSGSRINPKTKRRIKSYQLIRVRNHPWIYNANAEAEDKIFGILKHMMDRVVTEVNR